MLVAVVASVQVGMSLLCAMVLLSSIIAWISVHFSGPLPHILSFILGLLSLLNGIVTIFMIGITRFKKKVAITSLIVNIVTLLASIALFIPWVMEFESFCKSCSEPQQTQTCIDVCQDECCFIDMSRPIALVMVVFSAFTLLASFVGIVCAAIYLRFSSNSDSSKER